jgi:hypothetical protein
MLKYSVLIRGRHDQPIRSVVLLLCPAADGPAMTGHLHYNLPDGTLYLGYDYDVVRLWKLPPEQILRAGLAALPLAPLANVSEQDLPGVTQTIHTGSTGKPRRARPRPTCWRRICWRGFGLTNPGSNNFFREPAP